MKSMTDNQAFIAEVNDPLLQQDYVFLRQLKHHIKVLAAKAFAELSGKDIVEMVGVTAIIHGKRLNDMYDHAPGMAFFTVNSSRIVEVRDFADLSETRDAAHREFCRLHSEYEAAEDHDGLFSPSRIVVTGPNGGVLALYESGQWLTSSIPHQEWALAEDEIRSLRQDAVNEERWDNFATASCLRDKATLLSLKLSLALQHDSCVVVPGDMQ